MKIKLFNGVRMKFFMVLLFSFNESLKAWYLPNKYTKWKTNIETSQIDFVSLEKFLSSDKQSINY
jgi:hypothetical protein